MEKCPECAGLIILHQGEYVCSECGLVLHRHYVMPSYVMNNEKTSSRKLGKPFMNLGERLHIVDGLGSYMDYHRSYFFHDIGGGSLSPKKQKLFRRLKYRYDLNTRMYKRQADYRAFKTLNHVAGTLDLSDKIRNRAAYYYRKTTRKMKGSITNRILIMALSVLLSIREYGRNAPLTLKEISNAFSQLGHKISEKMILKAALRFRSKVGFTPNVRKSEEYICRIISEVIESPETRSRLAEGKIDPEKYKEKLEKKAFEILHSIPSHLRGGRNPYIFAAATIYTADQKLARETGNMYILTQKIIAEITKVAEYSIRDHFCSLLKPRIIQ